jgi:hypothetical protein
VDLFEEIRNEKPEYLKVPITHSKSTKSRPPKFFDMHLHESLRLKNIVFLDNLPKALSDVFEENLGQDPSNQHCWVEQQEIRVNAIRNESDLAHHYRDIIAHKHMAVASKLKFGKHPIFRWGISPSVPESMTRVVEAVGDGFIFVNPAAVKDLSATEQKNFKLLEDYGLVNFAVWELKNLVCGPKVMKEIPNLEGPFLWKACGERSEDDQVSSHCDSAIKTHRVNGNLVETGRRTGPDSSLARAMINKATSSEPSRVGSKRKESLSIPERAAAKRRKPQLKRTTPEPQHKSKNKKLPIVDARELIQQVCHANFTTIFLNNFVKGWTEAVVEDATFIIFSAGNEEYIGIRDRESQTLYLSGVIKPSQQADPNYGKIHVGLCIVAYDDAVDRVQKLSEGKTPWRWDLNLEKQPVFAARPKVTPDSNLTTTAQGDFDAVRDSILVCHQEFTQIT